VDLAQGVQRVDFARAVAGGTGQVDGLPEAALRKASWLPVYIHRTGHGDDPPGVGLP
jgi:hypothetical protein